MGAHGYLIRALWCSPWPTALPLPPVYLPAETPVAENATIYKAQPHPGEFRPPGVRRLQPNPSAPPLRDARAHDGAGAGVLLPRRENLVFTKGLSSTDEPALWRKHDNGTLLEWIDVGSPRSSA